MAGGSFESGGDCKIARPDAKSKSEVQTKKTLCGSAAPRLCVKDQNPHPTPDPKSKSEVQTKKTPLRLGDLCVLASKSKPSPTRLARAYSIIRA
ncbi:MAG: hypothetical protein CO108_30940, partial [Deltaproteobacteria bacterium CG_4_9_14_3_um_filter_63_12]